MLKALRAILNRTSTSSSDENQVFRARQRIALKYLAGQGVEVGAGDRPWPVPDNAKVYYGDVRGREELELYFKNKSVKLNGDIDAQSFSSVTDSTFDFVISAHVIEHLADPIGAVRHAMRVLKPNGLFILAVSEMTKTFDQLREPTPLLHLLQDELDGGESSRYWSCVEHVRYVHRYLTGEIIPEDKIHVHANRLLAAKMDMHWHAWTANTFKEMLQSIEGLFTIKAHRAVANENIFVLKKRPSPKPYAR